MKAEEAKIAMKAEEAKIAANAGLNDDGNLSQKARSQALTEEDEKKIAEGAEKAKKEHREQEEASFDTVEELTLYRMITSWKSSTSRMSEKRPRSNTRH